MKKSAYNIQMSFNVPESEKKIAQEAAEQFAAVDNELKLAVDHLNLFTTAFGQLTSPDMDDVLKHRILLRSYRDQVLINFNNIDDLIKKTSVLMGNFSTDSETVNMLNAFLSQWVDVKKEVNQFLGLFSNISNGNFIASVIKSITDIKLLIEQIKPLISDRIIQHIETNIIGKSWTNEITDENDNKVYQKLPLFLQLYKDRQNKG